MLCGRYGKFGLHSSKIKKAGMSKELAFRLIQDEYKQLFGKELTPEVYKGVMKGYSEGIKQAMKHKMVIRLARLGTLQPNRHRMKLNITEKILKRVAGYNNTPYICVKNGNESGSLFKPKYYGTLNQSTAQTTEGEVNP